MKCEMKLFIHFKTSSATDEVWEWVLSDFIPHFTGHVVNYINRCWEVKQC